MRSLCLLGVLSLLSGTPRAQTVRRPPAKPAKKAVKAVAAKPFVLPVSPTTGRVAYYDTVRVSGVEGNRLINRILDRFLKDALYYQDGPLQPTDTSAVYTLGPPAAAGETVFWGSITMVAPSSRPRPVFVPGISPLPAPGDPTPAAAGPPAQRLNFALRLRAELGVCYVTVTDLRQHPLSDAWAESLQQYRRTHAGPFPLALLSQPVEILYAAWLPHALSAVKEAPLPASRQPSRTTEAHAREADAYARGLLDLVRYAWH